MEMMGITSKPATCIFPKSNPSKVYISMKKPTIKSFNTYIIPTKRRVVIKKKVGNLHLTVKKLSKGQEIIIVKLSTKTVKTI